MDEILTGAVWRMRKKDDYKAGQEVNASLIASGGTSYQLYVPSGGCSNACTFCNYGFKHPVRKEEILKKVEHICRYLPANIETLILESSGSFLDEREIPAELQYQIMEIVARTKVKRVQIETHYKTITDEKVEKILQILEGHEIAFEIGLESTTKTTLDIYNKDIDVKELFRKVWYWDSLGIEVSLNVMFGAPLLTRQEQVQDTLNTVQDILEKCPESTCIVLFPLNVKDFTLVKHMYDKGRYSIVSHWGFIEVLTKIPKNALHRVFISWWGNRTNEFHGRDAIIYPKSCEKCHHILKAFYGSFVEAESLQEKQRLVEKISKVNCKCRDDYEREKAIEKPDKDIRQRLAEEKEKLKDEIEL